MIILVYKTKGGGREARGGRYRSGYDTTENTITNEEKNIYIIPGSAMRSIMIGSIIFQINGS